MQHSRVRLLIGAALAAVASAGVMATSAHTNAVDRAAPTQSVGRSRAIQPVRHGSFGGASTGRRAAFGWTDRHARRVAAKKRNVVRHRARGRGRA